MMQIPGFNENLLSSIILVIILYGKESSAMCIDYICGLGSTSQCPQAKSGSIPVLISEIYMPILLCVSIAAFPQIMTNSG